MSLALDPFQQITLNVIDGQCLWGQENDDQRTLFAAGGGRSGVMVTDIMVYFVNNIRKPDSTPLNGCAGHKPALPAVVVAAGGSWWTMAHQVGHVLLGPHFNPVHEPKSVYVMFIPTQSITATLPGLTEADCPRDAAQPVLLPDLTRLSGPMRPPTSCGATVPRIPVRALPHPPSKTSLALPHLS